MKRLLNHMNLYKLSLVCQIVSLYLIVTGQVGWYLYVLLGFIFVERAFFELVLWWLAKIQIQAARELMRTLAEANEMMNLPFDQEID